MWDVMKNVMKDALRNAISIETGSETEIEIRSEIKNAIKNARCLIAVALVCAMAIGLCSTALARGTVISKSVSPSASSSKTGASTSGSSSSSTASGTSVSNIKTASSVGPGSASTSAKSTVTKPEISAEGAILVDADTGEVLFEKNADTRYYPASITKILTGLLVVENADLSSMVTFSTSAVTGLDKGAVVLGVKAGESFSVRDCMYALLLKSANEVANGLAEHVSGSVSAFAQLMTQRARQLGCTNTNFTNPHGLTNVNHYTTARDMAIIARACYANEVLLEFNSTTNYTFPATITSPNGPKLTMGHKMMHESDSRYYEGVIAGKTGYTSAAGNTLVTYAKRGDTRLITVILKSKQTHYEDTKALLDYGFEVLGTDTKSTIIGPGANLSGKSTGASASDGTSVTMVSPNTSTSSGTSSSSSPSGTSTNTTATSTTDSTSNTSSTSSASTTSSTAGWVKDEHGWYYLWADGNYPTSGIHEINGLKYYFNRYGYMKVGWCEDAHSWYYFSEGSGAMKTSAWILYKDAWYYMGSDGKMLVDTTTPDGYVVDKNGAEVE
jgi:serine-type D-Ala-D-Ala carboxypeptidase (penicillin-binding protein 5/6)